MVYDVTLFVGQNTTMEYDSTGNIVQKSVTSAIESFQVPSAKVGRFNILKDPVVNHLNIYILELFDLPLDIVSSFKHNLIFDIFIRVGSGNKDGSPNYNLYQLHIRPITIVEQAIQPDKLLNDIVVKGISLTSNSIILDASLGGELNNRNPDSNSHSIGITNGKVDTSTLAKVNLLNSNNNVGISNNNPGNLDRTNANWEGKIQNNSDRQEAFITPEYGVRAWAINAKGKINQGYNTVDKLLNLLTPEKDVYNGKVGSNNTPKYIGDAAKVLGWTEDEVKNRVITEADLANVMKVIIPLESDRAIATNYYTDEIINRGFAMGNIKSAVTVNPGSWFYGKGGSAGVNFSSTKPMSINPFNNTKGVTLLDNVLTAMANKYKIETDRTANSTNLRSNYMYQIVNLPGVSTFELLKKIHKEYPSYYIEVPWILDETRVDSDVNKLGKTWYTEVSVTNINSLPVRSIYKEESGGSKANAYSYMNIVETRPFYTETVEKIEATKFVHKDLTTGTTTIINPKSVTNVAKIPDQQGNTNNSVSLTNLSISTVNTVNVETNYDAKEFEKRLEMYKKHVATNPQIIRCEIKCDDPSFLQFGVAYSFDQQQLNKVTPYKLRLTFENKANKFQLTWLVDFYKGVDIV